jgi:hypothetical protein
VADLTPEQAYLAMFSFLEGLYERSKADDVGALLGSMSLLPDGRPSDPAFVEDWRLAVEAALTGKVDAAMRLTK